MSETRITHVAAGILIRPDGQFLLGTRPEGKPYAGWWEYPGGKLEAGETPMQALVRELHEELGIEVTAATPWVVQTFTYPHATVRLNFFKVTGWNGEPHPHEGQQFAWQIPGATTVEPILPANTPILRGLQLPGVLPISNIAELGEDAWLAALGKQVAAGRRWLVLREPQLVDEAYAAVARRLQADHPGLHLMVHGTPERAAQLGAYGVHMPARVLMQCTERPETWCGASVHTLDELAHAAKLGIDYAVLGSVLPSLTHPGGPILGWEGFGKLVERGWPMPVYGIGGLRREDVAQAQALGGQGVALLRAAWG
ncbi:MAG: Nudix family hydrolase [Burkholderiales bacterium]|nr:Nudix family hydrolase [Burkholderiales bacterium]